MSLVLRDCEGAASVTSTREFEYCSSVRRFLFQHNFSPYQTHSGNFVISATLQKRHDVDGRGGLEDSSKICILFLGRRTKSTISDFVTVC